MINRTNNNKQENPKPVIKRNTIQIMRGALQPELIYDLIDCLEEEGHQCAIFDGFEGIHAALNNPRSKLLFLGVGSSDSAKLTEAIRANGGNVHDIPILVYFKQHLPNIEQEKLVLEIDDFILDPLNPNDVYLRIRRLLRRHNERKDELEQTKQNLVIHLGMQQFIGKAPSFIAAIEKIPRIAAYDVGVLLTGDTGTGKEMCARAIHYLSPRAHKPFIPINCGSIPPELFENELFGHEPGAFTDARRVRRGLIAEAEGGTLFLDEVDSLPASAQVKLLRFLQDHQYRPLGASHFRKANTRLLAASNQNLQHRVREGAFREDLYHRLKVISLKLPTLRDRQEDIVPLAMHFLKMLACEYKLPVPKLSHNAIQKLMAYSWPGNVRELENTIRQSLILTDGPVLRAHHLHLSPDTQSHGVSVVKEPFKVAKARVIEAFERAYLNEIIAAADGNISRAAREAKKNRRSFFALLKKHGLTFNHQSLVEE